MPTHACGPNSHAWLKNVTCCSLAWHNSQKFVNSDPCKERKPCEKGINDITFLAISDFWSEKHWEWVCVYTGTGTSDGFGRLRDSSEEFGLHRESSEMIVWSSKILALPGQKFHAYISEKVGRYINSIVCLINLNQSISLEEGGLVGLTIIMQTLPYLHCIHW